MVVKARVHITVGHVANLSVVMVSRIGDGVQTLSELDNNFKRAFIKFVNVDLEKLLRAMDQQTRAMDNLARQINLMPRTVRMRPG